MWNWVIKIRVYSKMKYNGRILIDLINNDKKKLIKDKWDGIIKSKIFKAIIFLIKEYFKVVQI